MKFALTLAAAVVLAGLALSAMPALAAVDAARALSIANQNACMGRHAVDRKLVGLAYQDVAKYKGDAGAQAKLIKKVRRRHGHLGPGSRCRPTRRLPMPI